MTFLRILYWGLSYTAGIVCLTGLALRYFQHKDGPTLKLILFLLPFGLSVLSLSMMEALYANHLYQTIAGYLALVGASLVIVTFPAYALCFDPTKRRRRLSLAFRVIGWGAAAVNIVLFFLPDFPGKGWPQFLTLLALGLAVFVGMAWIARTRPAWGPKTSPRSMTALFAAFGLAFVLDLLRGFFPPLRFLGDRYIVFPGFYAFLNIFLFYFQVRVWAQGLREGSDAEAASADCLRRYGISEREGEVLALLARGHTYNEIADSLCLSLATIKTHVSHLYEKTGTRNKIELLNVTFPRIGRSVDSA